MGAKGSGNRTVKVRPARATHSEIVRDRIQTTTIVNKLTKHVLGKCEMTATQVTAGIALLRKVLPDLAQVEQRVTGDVTVHAVSDKPLTEEQWAAQYAPKPVTSVGPNPKLN